MDDRTQRIAVFHDTVQQIEKNTALNESVKASIAGQQLFLEGSELEDTVTSPRYEQDAEIIVSSKRTFEAASAYAAAGLKTLVLNFASATNPGGGVANGSSAQEECLCRCSTLYPCISERQIKASFHDAHKSALRNGVLDALYNDDCIYTPGVLVIKTDTRMPVLMPQDQWYSLDVITCAAPNLREKPSNAMNPGSGNMVKISNEDLQKLHEKRCSRILDIARTKGAEVVILGAFGCGAFRNPPDVVAAGIKAAVMKHRKDFKTIEFAIYCGPRDTSNYDAFRQEFSS